MLNSDLDLDTNTSQTVTRSQPSSDRQLITELSIEPSTAMPIFADATAQAVRLTNTPVSMLTTIAGSRSQINSISGLEPLSSSSIATNLHLELAEIESYHAQRIGGKGACIVTDFQNYPQLFHSSLYRGYGIRSYLGFPILTAAKDRLGMLSILDIVPRQFNDREIDLLELLARLVASEFERKLLSQAQLNRWIGDLKPLALRGFDDIEAAAEHTLTTAKKQPLKRATATIGDQAIVLPIDNSSVISLPVDSEIQFKLLTHLAQELRTPLTSVLGMASVLQQEIYGSLSSKQKDYLGIIYHSGQQLVTIVDEIAQLGKFDRHQHHLNLKSVDLKMLCQLAIQSLEPLTQKKQQQIILDLCGGSILTNNPSDHLWLLDKDKVRQIIYYLSLSLIDATSNNHQIAIQVANCTDGLQIQLITKDLQVRLDSLLVDEELAMLIGTKGTESLSLTPASDHDRESNINPNRHIRLGLALSHTLAAIHGGKIEVIAHGQGYQLSLPLIIADREA